ncbi:MAG TPA: hypothetical protein VM345_09915, partial [Acidimicrobiales bacterium]|nr:hypothetical protein [Acidimicrobiales bacterium]
FGATTTPGPTAQPSRPRVQAQLAGESRPRSPWWLWLLLPTGLGLAYAFSRSMEEQPAAVRGGRGALTRLMAATPEPTSPTP